MILIISTEKDASTDDVIDWLAYYKCEYIRLNAEDIINEIILELDDKSKYFILKTASKQIDSRKIKVIWYRKNGINFKFDLCSIYNISKRNRNDINTRELMRIREFIEYCLLEKPLIGKCVVTKDLNKLIVLDIAKKKGFKIPNTYIFSNKHHVSGNSFIIKAISDVFFLNFRKNRRLITYTAELDPNKNQLALRFFPTLFQEKIEKEFEVRVFHFLGKNYSIAIFSQNNNQTKIDFRKYDTEHPNRTVPYKLDDELDSMVTQLMKELELDTGSIDLIMDKKGDAYFLEVNPSGQFGMVSIPGQFMLEREIAKELIKKQYIE